MTTTSPTCRNCGQHTSTTSTPMPGGRTTHMAWPHLTSAAWHEAAECVTDDRS